MQLSTPPLRQLCFYSPENTASTHFIFNDDESEKRRRRESFLRKKALTPKRSGGNQASASNSQRQQINQNFSSSPMPKISIEQMHVNFEEWLKMATDNKINTHNSWRLALIDYFYEMSLLREGDSINFQKASCTLDGCIKIYTSRVDSVATETGKLLNGLAQNSIPEDENENEDEELHQKEQPQIRVSRRISSKTTRSEPTLVKEYSTLTLKKFDLEFEVDPLFKKTSADFDEGGAGGLLLNHLFIDTESKIIFDSAGTVADLNNSEEKMTEMKEVEIEELKINIRKLRGKFQEELKEIFKTDICPSLKEFDISMKDEGDIEILRDDSENILEDEETDLVEENDSLNFGHPQVFENLFSDTESVVHEFNLGQQIAERDIAISYADEINDYFSYFDSSFSNSWTGPEHWKVKHITKEKSETSIQVFKRREKRVSSFIDFKNADYIDENVLFVKGGSSICLPKSSEFFNWHLLPDDMHFTSQKLFLLFLKPRDKSRQNIILAANKIEISDGKKDGQNEISLNPPTGFPYTNAGFLFEVLTDTFGNQENAVYEDDMFELSGEYDEHLVSLPKVIKPETIPYARLQKKIDVKQLKDNLWKTMTNASFHNQQRLSNTFPPNLSTSSQDENGKEKISGAYKFTDIIHNLKPFYTQLMMKDISVSFCFVCLLYLANEKNLNLISNETCTDLLIVQESDPVHDNIY
ncbi:hypothetical protein G9A89_001705 [Geosiphon pyriformis]|nr:hypothetical protein G9A89_001705 [Geosiphon pyriformis]